jgi:hypothetical protein
VRKRGIASYLQMMRLKAANQLLLTLATTISV